MLLRALLTASLVACGSSAMAEEFPGRVVGLSDGDTITVLRDSTPVNVRLHAVDCPEKAQPFGAKAKRFTSDMVLGKVVTVKIVAGARFARVSVGGKNLNEELLRAGLAWWYRPQAPNDKRLAALVAEAAGAKRGLWADARPIPPWVWRNPRDKTDPILERRLQETAWTEDGVFRVEYHGDTQSKLFHAVGCKDCDKSCAARFTSVDEAKKAGYRPHSACTGSAATNASCVRDQDCRLVQCGCTMQAFGPHESSCKQGPICPDEPGAAVARCVRGRCKAILAPAASLPAAAADPDRACRRDSDCLLDPPTVCRCPQPRSCASTWRTAVNRAAYQRAVRRYKRDLGYTRCARCRECPTEAKWLGTRAVCANGQCSAR